MRSHISVNCQCSVLLAIRSRAVLMSCQFQFTPRYNGPLEYITMWLCLFLSLPTCELLKNLKGACDFGSLFEVHSLEHV